MKSKKTLYVRLQVHFEWKLQFEFGNYKTIMHNVRQTIIWKKIKNQDHN